MLEAQAIRARRAARRAAARKLASKKKKRADAKGDEEADDEYDALLLGNRGASISDETPATRGPLSVDVFVPLSTRCVVITGPNTGGKTAAMKAVGLASLMARAGLFIPAEIANLPWFDDVLVDIGDSQDLMQSLSTFSARLAKQRAVLRACTPRALVLMDEVGTGTSPAEGAAIGGALLERLAGVQTAGGGGGGGGAAGLVLATTHHGELKALKYEHEGGVFENAAVEFDEVELAPTYRLLWGVPGRSRALQIAERFGMEPAVVADARIGRWGGTASPWRRPSPRWRRRGETRTKTSPPRVCCCRRCGGPCPGSSAPRTRRKPPTTKPTPKSPPRWRARRARSRCAPARRRARGDVRGGARAAAAVHAERQDGLRGGGGGGGGGRAREKTARRRGGGAAGGGGGGGARRRAGWMPGVGEDVVVTRPPGCVEKSRR